MRWIVRLLALLIALALLVAGGGYVWLRGSLPEVDGHRSVAGITAPVEIIRDRHGVPHIIGQTEEDVFFALGYAHAQDRLWQMEVSRRLGAGRLSEVMGADTLGLDKGMRVLGIYRAAQQNYANLDGGTRAILAVLRQGRERVHRHPRPGPPAPCRPSSSSSASSRSPGPRRTPWCGAR